MKTDQPFDNKHMRSVALFKLRQAKEALELMLRSEKLPSAATAARGAIEEIDHCLFMIPSPPEEK